MLFDHNNLDPSSREPGHDPNDRLYHYSPHVVDDISLDGESRENPPDQFMDAMLELSRTKRHALAMDMVGNVGRLNQGIFNNAIALQTFPRATHLESATGWRTLGRRILPETHPAVALRVNGPIEFVWDIGDTVPLDQHHDVTDPRAERRKMLDGLHIDVSEDLHRLMCSGMTEIEFHLVDGQDEPVTLQRQEITGKKRHVHGCYSYLLRCSTTADPGTVWDALIRTLAGIHLRHFGLKPGAITGSHRNGIDPQALLFEREAVAWILERRRKPQTPPPSALKPWIDGAEIPGDVRLRMVFTAAGTIDRCMRWNRL